MTTPLLFGMAVFVVVTIIIAGMYAIHRVEMRHHILLPDRIFTILVLAALITGLLLVTIIGG